MGRGQDGGFTFDRVSARNNLTHNAIRAIYQDRKGFLWIATKAGLELYNGAFFFNYRNDNGDHSLSSDTVTTLLEDSQGRFWVGTRGGLNEFVRGENRFIHYHSKAGDPGAICGDDITKVVEDRQGFLWIGSDKGLSRYDRRTNRFDNFRHEASEGHSLQADAVNTLFLDSRGDLWVAYAEGQLDWIPVSEPGRADRRGMLSGIRHFRLDPTRLSGHAASVNRMIETKDGRFWLGTEGGGLLVFPSLPAARSEAGPDGVAVLAGFVSIDTSSRPQTLTNNSVQDILADSRGNVWVATFGGGITILGADGRVSSCTYSPYAPETLGSNSIQALFEDRSGNVWVGALTGGLNKYTPVSHGFTVYRSDIAHGNLKSDLVTAIYQDADGILWLGTRNGLNRFDRAKNTCEVFLQDPDNRFTPTEKVIRSVYEDAQHYLWVGTTKGLFRFDKQQKRFVSYPEALRQLTATTPVRALYCDRAGILWVGTMGGLIRFDPVTSDIRTYRHEPANPQSLAHNYVWAIYADRRGTLWVGTRDGISRYLKDRDAFSSYRFKAHLEKTDPNAYHSQNLITSICEDLKGEIWTDSFGAGLNRLVRTSKPIDAADAYRIVDFSLPAVDGQSTSGVMVDAENNLWVGTDSGILKVRPGRDSVRLYDVNDGATANELNSGSFFHSASGEFYYGGNNGMLAFRPASFTENRQVPAVVLTSFRVFDKPRLSGAAAAAAERVDLNYSDYVLTFSFAALDFSAPQKNHYRYKLEGFDRDWVDAGNRTEVTYMNLKGGEYVLRVAGSNDDQIWNNEGLTLRVSVVPPVWERAWFRVLAILLGGGLVALAATGRIRHVERQKRALEQEVRLRTEDLRTVNRQLEGEVSVRRAAEDSLRQANALLSESNATKDKLFSIVSHDLKGPIGGIVAMLRELQQEDEADPIERATIIGEMVESAENTYSMLVDLLDWARTQRSAILLQPESLRLAGIAEEVVAFLSGMAARKAIDLRVDVDPTLVAWCDRNTVSTVIRNLTSNALKFTPEGGRVGIRATNEATRVVIAVSDTGVGMTPSALNEIFEKAKVVTTFGTHGEKGTGLGLILCMEFVRRNGGEIWGESTPGAGTTIAFSLPKPPAN